MLSGLRLAILACLTACCFASAGPLAASGRVALVIGNGDYANTKALPNPPHDAGDMAQMLERLGFAVTKVIDGSFNDLRTAIRAFNVESQDADIALVYYAGHGMELGGENWLIPVDADLKSDLDLANEAVSLKTIMQSVSRAHDLGIVILDACRDNPFAAKMTRSKLSRSVDRGFARVEPTTNVLVAYAAKDGTTATDGSGRNSPYTAALLRHLDSQNLEIGLAFREVRDDVMRATGKRQQPFVYGSLSGRAIYLNQAEHPVAPGAAAPRAADETVWQAINQSNDAKLFENFVSRFPDSAHATDAQTRLADLQAANECDRLTASASGKDHARNLGGSDAAGSDPDAAKRACDAAMRQFPGVARFAYQGGRTAEAGQDYALARTLYDTAAGEGSAAAMVSLGVLYESDRGGAQNFAQARDLYERAAALGDRQAELRLGSLYETGHGVDKDLGQARRWYEKSAALGEQTAMEKLSIFYQRGLGGPKSKAEARKWQKKAQSAGEQRTATSKAEQ